MLIRRGLVLGSVCAISALFLPAHSQAAPANDHYADRLPLQIGFLDTTSNSDATVEPNERLTANDPNGFGCEPSGSEGTSGVPVKNTLWWSFQGTGGPVTVSTRGSDVDTVLAIYEFGTSQLVGCNDDLQPFDETREELHYNVDSEMFFETVTGREYSVQIGACTPVPPGTCGVATGKISLRVSVPPANDDRANAQPVSAGGPVASTNTGATREPGESPACGKSLYGKTVWFRYSPPSVGDAVIAVSGFDTVVAIYREGSTTPMACNDDAVKGESGASQLPSVAPAGQPLRLIPANYLIQVGGYLDSGFSDVAAANGPLQLQITFSEDPDVDDDGFARPADCNDESPAVHPGALEVQNNDTDEDCDGLKAADHDGDGHLAEPLGRDCSDGNTKIHPGAREIRGNRIDENCDGKKTPYRYLRPNIQMGSFAYGGDDPHIQIREVFVMSVLRDSRVEMRCRGGCPFRSKGPIRIRRAGGKIVIAHGFQVEIGAEVQVRVTKAGWIGKVKIFRFPPGKPRKDRERCISPSGALRACA